MPHEVTVGPLHAYLQHDNQGDYHNLFYIFMFATVPWFLVCELENPGNLENARTRRDGMELGRQEAVEMRIDIGRSAPAAARAALTP